MLARRVRSSELVFFSPGALKWNLWGPQHCWGLSALENVTPTLGVLAPLVTLRTAEDFLSLSSSGGPTHPALQTLPEGVPAQAPSQPRGATRVCFRARGHPGQQPLSLLLPFPLVPPALHPVPRGLVEGNDLLPKTAVTPTWPSCPKRSWAQGSLQAVSREEVSDPRPLLLSSASTEASSLCARGEGHGALTTLPCWGDRIGASQQGAAFSPENLSLKHSAPCSPHLRMRHCTNGHWHPKSHSGKHWGVWGCLAVVRLMVWGELPAIT